MKLKIGLNYHETNIFKDLPEDVKLNLLKEIKNLVNDKIYNYYDSIHFQEVLKFVEEYNNKLEKNK